VRVTASAWLLAPQMTDGTTREQALVVGVGAAEYATNAEGESVLDDADDVAALVARVPGLTGTRFTIAKLPGGLTNRNYTLTGPDGRRAVLRRSDPQSALLAIDRECEYLNTVAAALAGVGPKVVGYLPGEGVLVVDWIEGRTFSDADLTDDAVLRRVAHTCAALHAGPRFANDFDMFEIQQGYLRIVFERGFRLPPRYLDFAAQVEQIRAALAVAPQPTVPCHNDLLAANIMDDGTRTWFIDYEYAGNNDPCFELGNIWSEANLEVGLLGELVDAYFGFHSPALIARARLLGLMSKYGWMLWASISQSTSSVEFDFWGWGLEKYERAIAEFDGPEFSALITDVQHAR
jgi:thiamine kinase-like enzyme